MPESEEGRIDHLRRSTVWTDIATATLDLLEGPQGPGSFTFGQEVICRYHTPGSVMGGASPKFLCDIDGEIVKVKCLPDLADPSSNREIFAEIAATRLLWALGFAADRSYPVLLRCVGCPASPMDGPTSEEQGSGNYQHATTSLGIALIERRFDGQTIETEPDEGWKWTELDEYVGTYSRDEIRSVQRTAELTETRAHVEALKFLQVFVQHGDCKPKQQRLVCLPEHATGQNAIVLADSARTACARTCVVVDDVGSTFGGAGNFTGSSAKIDLKHWVAKDVIDLEHYERTGGQCRGILNTSMSCSGGLENPILTETGRRFLLARLQLLGDEQIRDLFIAAQVDKLDKGDLDSWVEAFKGKVRQIASHPCRDR